jgi:hypothetical protein
MNKRLDLRSRGLRSIHAKQKFAVLRNYRNTRKPEKGHTEFFVFAEIKKKK